MRAGFQNRRREAARSLVALLLLLYCGCAHLAEVKLTLTRLPTAPGNDEQLQPARRYLVAAEREHPLVSLGKDISAARLSLNVLEQRSDDSFAQNLYNFSVAHAVQNIARKSSTVVATNQWLH